MLLKLNTVRKHSKFLASFFAINLLVEIISPAAAYALTGGPSQPEVQSFEPVGTSEMVDVFSGDFNYNIPLMDVGGYPLNIAYHAGITMDQEASWVGLGWNLNPGVINRNMRGLPDDYDGSQGDDADIVERETNIKKNVTQGATVGIDAEIFGAGIGSLGVNFGIIYNNYRGWSHEVGMNPSISIGKAFKTRMGAAFNYNSASGLDVNPSLSFSYSHTKEQEKNEYGTTSGGFSIGKGMNSRSGMKTMNMGLNLQVSNDREYKNEKGETEYAHISDGAVGSSATYNFGTQTYTTKMTTPMLNSGYTFNFTLGFDAFGVHPNMRVSGFHSSSEIMHGSFYKGAFGYLNEHKKTDDNVLLDYNREQDHGLHDNSTNLPITNHTFDIFSVSGQGAGGSYRTYRGDIGIVHDDFTEYTNMNSASLGLELGLGNIVHKGIDFYSTFNHVMSGYWRPEDANGFGDKKHFGQYLSKKFDFTGAGATAQYEPSYFKPAGEMSMSDEDFMNILKGDRAVKAYIPHRSDVLDGQIEVASEYTKAKKKLPGYQYMPSGTPRENIRQKRDKRNKSMSFLTRRERDVFGLEKSIYSATINSRFTNGAITRSIAKNTNRKDHHISEMTILNDDGSRYIYGIPAYNNMQIEKTFNVSDRSFNCTSGQVTYESGDNSDLNTRGDDHYYTKTKTPGYAHSFLLTGVISPDYVDITGNGISDDDFGTGVKFNYTRVKSDYKWRIPYNSYSANFQEGMKSKAEDNMGSYVYGTKEVWHMHSIESKNHIAFFVISAREDGLGVSGEDGGKNLSEVSYKLDRIELYNKHDYRINGTNAEPIKIVYFEYDYSLCPNVENNSGNTSVPGNSAKGKLTLKKISFSYGKSSKGRFSPYKFNYSDINPAYNLKDNDAWGTYKPNADGGCAVQYKSNLSPSELTTLKNSSPTNGEFPFTDQDKETADEYANAWSLSEVFLPSGGKLKIVMESDDYAYVQDRQAMQMFKITGFGYKDGSDIEPMGDWLYNSSHQGDVILFELDSSITAGSGAADEVKRLYLEGIKDLQVTVLADIDEKHHYEYVKSYVELDWDLGCGVNSAGTHGWVGIKKVEYGDKKKMTGNPLVNPISRSIWNYARLNADFLVNPEAYKNSEIGYESKKERAKIPAIVREMKSLFQGYNFTLETRSFGRRVILNRSWVRLNNPVRKKLGGGHRVKKISISDNWSEMGAANTGAEDSEFGQEYSYTMTETGKDNVPRSISSGVCTYEPTTGGDENPFKQPRTVSIENKMVPDEFFQLEEPMGESFFPAASIGYSRVTVKSLSRNAVKRTGTGYEVSEFYTSKDFPVIVKETKLSLEKLEPKKFFSLFSLNHTTKVTATQGYTIELNDMHGKPKSSFSYAEGKSQPYSGIKYVYKTDADNPQKLYNKVPIVDTDGKINDRTIATDYDVVHDMNQHFDRTTSTGISVNGETFFLIVSLVKIPTILPKFKKVTTQVRTAVTTKIINRYGILDKTIAYQEGASIETKNLLWDSETGQILLTSVQNEFRDSVFNFTYPAHWAYEGMGQAYKNIDIRMDNMRLRNKKIELPGGLNPENYLVPGDECLIGNYVEISGSRKVYIEMFANQRRAFVYRGTDGHLNLIDDFGVPLGAGTDNTKYRLKVVRSGRRNMQSAPVGSVTLLKNPIRGTGANKTLVFEEILNAEAVEYSDQWQTYLDYAKDYPCDTIFTTKGTEFIHLLNNMVDSGTFNKRYQINSTFTLTKDSGYCRSLYDSLLSSTYRRYETQKKLGSTYTRIGGLGSSSVQKDTCAYDYFGQVQDTFHRYRLYPGAVYKNICGFITTSFNLVSNVQYRASWSPWYDTTRIKEQFDSCTDSEVSDFYVSYPTKGLPNINFGGSCCRTDFSISAPYSKVLKFYDYRATGDSSIRARAIILNEDCTQDTVNVNFYNTCFQVKDCNIQCRSMLVKKHINPYRANMEGVWRSKRSHKFLEERNYAANPDPRHDGTYKSFSQFWEYDNTSKKYLPDTDNDKWVWASEVTKYAPFGPELENRDALGRYSSAIYGYNYTHPVAMASNSKYTQIAYDGFEDYDYFVFGGEQVCGQRHFNFRDMLNANILLDDQQQHTGKYSLKVVAGNAAEFSASLLPFTATLSTPYADDVTRITEPDDDLGTFTPEAGKYLLGGWVKCQVKDGDTAYIDAQIEVTITDASNVDHVYNLTGKHMIIEGWQRVEGIFEVPAGAKNIKVKLIADDEDAWFDDVRIHPFDGNMASYVYDNRTLRLMAELDANNYATFYEYDSEGALIRQKKETVNGVATLKEIKSSTVKRPGSTIIK